MGVRTAGRLGLAILLATSLGGGPLAAAAPAAPIQSAGAQPVPPRMTAEQMRAALGLTPARRAPVAGGQAQCGADVTTDVVLTADLVCDTPFGLVVSASNVTVDLNGHTITAAGDAFVGILVHNFRSEEPQPANVRIRNGKIRGFAECVNLLSGEGAQLERLDAAGCRDWGIIVTAPRTQVREVFVHDSAVGLDLWRFSDGSTASRSRFVGNRVGVLIESPQLTVRQNVISGNRDGILITDTDSPGGVSDTVTGNTVTANTFGLRVNLELAGDQALNTKIARNTFRANKAAGIVLQTFSAGNFTNAEITENILTRNGFRPELLTGPEDPAPVVADDGLVALARPAGEGRLGGFVLRRNLAVSNVGYGIEAPGVTDGGGNLAVLNGQRQQCVGVRCRPLSSINRR